jgi:hypothetical protein
MRISWCHTTTEHLDEERQKKLESDNCMMVRNSLARASVPYTVRHAPWGGYCKIKPDDEDGIDTTPLINLHILDVWGDPLISARCHLHLPFSIHFSIHLQINGQGLC